MCDPHATVAKVLATRPLNLSFGRVLVDNKLVEWLNLGPVRDIVKAAGAKVCSGTVDRDSNGDADKAVQEKLRNITERCVALTYDVMRRLPRAERRRFENIFWNVHHAFAVVRSRATEGCCTLQMVLVIAEKLDVLRKLVSSACGVPLPVDMEDSKLIIPFNVAVFPEDGMLVVFAMIDNLFDTIKSDIDHMISAMQ
ncbi:hypothetical protein PVAP13_5NG445240 [Panicum virgatum]|uniref:Uncharacterized protein n=1 Tax=Panicum virgatum TaxID=38727 RepID=A0A8T0S2T0_PANVG|nr:hypothetical protein PVAP13_5NG445240 [Panicum virgatum]